MEKRLREYLAELENQLKRSSNAEEIIRLTDEIERVERKLGLVWDVRKEVEARFFRDVQFVPTLEQIEAEILERGGKCANCGKPLTRGSIRSYPHPDGIETADKGKQWVYFHCKRCGLDSALWKVLQQIQAEEVVRK